MQSKSKWVKSESMLEENIKSNSAKYGIPLKPRIDVVLKQIHLQTSKIDTILNDLKSKDREIFRKIVSSTDVDHAQYSAVLLSDLAQIRKVSKILSISKILFEELENNLSTRVRFCRFSYHIESRTGCCKESSIFSNPMYARNGGRNRIGF